MQKKVKCKLERDLKENKYVPRGMLAGEIKQKTQNKLKFTGIKAEQYRYAVDNVEELQKSGSVWSD